MAWQIDENQVWHISSSGEENMIGQTNDNRDAVQFYGQHFIPVELIRALIDKLAPLPEPVLTKASGEPTEEKPKRGRPRKAEAVVEDNE